MSIGMMFELQSKSLGEYDECTYCEAEPHQKMFLEVNDGLRFGIILVAIGATSNC
jgi:hypothetical protein